jgi:hypothetical protein
MVHWQKIWLGLGIGLIVGVAIGLGVYWGRQVERALPSAGPISPTSVTALPAPTPLAISATLTPTPFKPTPTKTSLAVDTPLAASAWLKNVPFIPQAPHKNWDALHEETCEEATVLTVVHYLEGQRQPEPDEIETELQNLIAWEQRVLGIYEDTNASETARMLSEYFDYGARVRVFDLNRLDDVKREIAAGRPVIVPVAGRLLGNRHFKVPGPIYHMVVVIGYTEDEIITHDPGTQFGANYRYPAETFWSAIHDFVDRTDEGMATGTKLGIVVDSLSQDD